MRANLLLALLLTFQPLVYANDKAPGHRLGAGVQCPPPPAPPAAPANVPDGGSNHNALAIGAVILLGVCLYHRCWEQTENKTADAQSSRVTPDIPANEYLRIRKQ